MKTVSISNFQKAPARTLKNIKWFSYILSNNKVEWMAFSKEMTEIFQESWLLDQLEDLYLMHSDKFKEEREEWKKVIETWDYSSCINFDELCKLA